MADQKQVKKDGGAAERLQRTFLWGGGIGLACTALWLLRPILLPFVAALVLAYCLDPAVTRLGRWRVPRWLGTTSVLLGFMLACAALALLLVPVVKDQVSALLEALPGFVASLKGRVVPLWGDWASRLSPQDVAKLREAAGSYADDAFGIFARLLKRVVLEGAALFDIATLLVVTPVVTFYVLRDWPKMTKVLDKTMPKRKYAFARRALAQINTTLSGFLRGQALVCLALGVFYGVGLTSVGLQYGVTIGLLSGLLSFIPYVGSLFGLIAGTILGAIQFDAFWDVGKIWAVFAVGQLLEGYVLTPKLVGDRVGLHPVWILFAIFAGGSLLGFVGILIAVPVAAVIGVLVRLGLARMKGEDDDDDDDAQGSA